MERRIFRGEIGVAIGAIAVAAAFLWAGRDLGPNPFEPVGSGAIPNAVAVIAILLCATQIAQTGLAARRKGVSPPQRELGLRVLGAFLLTILYTLVLASGYVRYGVATFAYFIVATLILAERPRPLLIWIGAAAITLAIGLDYVFRHIFSTDIP